MILSISRDSILKPLLIIFFLSTISFINSWINIINIALIIIIYAFATYLLFPKTIMNSFNFLFVLNIFYIIIKNLIETSSIDSCVDDIKKYLPLLISYIILSHIKINRDIRFVRNIIYFMIIVLFIRYISAIIVDLLFPNTARMIAGLGIEDPTRYYKIGAGSYSLINSGFLLILPLIYCYKNSRKVFFKTAIILLMILLIIVSAFVTNWATAILFSLLACFLSILIFGNIKKSIVIFYLFILIFSFMKLNTNWILQKYEMINIKNTLLHERVSDIVYSFAGIKVEGDLSARKELYSVSINSIQKNILLGNIHESVGGHAFFIDYTAHYGLIGLILLILTYISTLNLSMSICSKEYRKISVLNFILYILFGSVKNLIGYEFLLNLFVLGPLMVFYFEKEITLKKCYENRSLHNSEFSKKLYPIL